MPQSYFNYLQQYMVIMAEEVLKKYFNKENTGEIDNLSFQAEIMAEFAYLDYPALLAFREIIVNESALIVAKDIAGQALIKTLNYRHYPPAKTYSKTI